MSTQARLGSRAVLGRYRLETVCLGVTGSLCALMLAADLAVSHGHVLFTLDDPYIHLALAERLASSGHYGLNAGEVAAPASSILYPFLLVPLLWAGLGPASALLVCLAATVATVLLLCAVLRESGYRLDQLPALALAGIAAGWTLAFDIPGLALTGMEHSLHVALSLACLLGLLRVLQGGRLWWVLPPAAALLPLVRYEGASLWLVCCLVLACRRHFVAALIAFVPALAGLSAFSLFLVRNGLPPLPSSVLAKAGFGMLGAHSAAGNARAIVLNTIAVNVTQAGFIPLCFIAAINLAVFAVPSQRRLLGSAILPLTGAALCCAHLLAGKLGGVGRYEVYAELFGAVTALVAWSGVLAPALARGRPVTLVVAALLPMALLGNAVRVQMDGPAAAADLYAQQYQMRRFALAFWHRPIGVNDLGEVSYGNPDYVLDYAGLGSDAARVARSLAADPDWMDALATQHQVGLVIIFPAWFPQVPQGWQEMARLHLLVRNVIAGAPTVSFYATGATAAAQLAPLLPQFAAGLPASAELEIEPKKAGGFAPSTPTRGRPPGLP